MANSFPVPGFVPLPVIHGGRTEYPKVLGISSLGLEAFHSGTRTRLPLSWERLLSAGADMIGGTQAEFLEYLRTVAAEGDTPSGPSALTQPKRARQGTNGRSG